MKRHQAVLDRLENGEIILIDGATGTEIERRGVPMVDKGWNGGGALTHPDIVRSVHEAYIKTGANLVISNTFSTSRHVLEEAGLVEHFEFLNRRGVELAREARIRLQADHVLVAAGLTDLGHTNRRPSLGELQKNMDDQAAIMAAAGPDVFVLEMMTDIERMSIVLGAAQNTGLPVWVGFSCRMDATGTVRLLNGPTLADGLAAVLNKDVPVVCIMHTEVDDIDRCLDVVENHWEKPVGVYAHSGQFIQPNWIFNDTISPQDYAAAAGRWLDRGVQIIGGCCGIGIEHMRKVQEKVLARS